MWDAPWRGTPSPRSTVTTLPGSPPSTKSAKQMFGRSLPPGSPSGFRRKAPSPMSTLTPRGLALQPLVDANASDMPYYSVFAGDSTPQSPGSASFGVWRRAGKKALPARVRHEVASQRKMSELLEKIILEAHFQDRGGHKNESKERQLSAPHREPWPTVESLSQQDTAKAAIEILLEQSQAYGESVTEAARETQSSHTPPPVSPSRQRLHTPVDQQSDRGSSKGSTARRHVETDIKDIERSNSRSPSKRANSKKPGIPRTPTVKKNFAGWSHIRLAATALQPFGGIGAALKKTSGGKAGDKEEQDEDGANHDEEQQNDHKPEETPEAAPTPTPAKATMFDTCFALAKQYFVPLEEVRKCFEEFKQIDTSGDMLLTETEFEASAKQNLNWPEDQELPVHLARKIKKYFQDMDKDSNDVIDFTEFFDWSMKNRWSEEFLALDDKDMENRQLARQTGASIAEVERYRRMFDDFDTDGSDEISQSEFVYVIMQIMEVKDPRDISTQRLHRYWQEVDTDGSGSVSFQEFLNWMLTKGPEHVKRVW